MTRSIMLFKGLALALCLATVAVAENNDMEPAAYVCKSIKVCDSSSSWGVADAFNTLQPLFHTLHIAPMSDYVEVTAADSKFVSDACSCQSPVDVKVSIPVYQQGMIDTIAILVDDYFERSIAPGMKSLPQAGCWADVSAEFASKEPMCVKPKQAAAPHGSICKKLTFCQDETDMSAAREQVTATLQPLFDLINLPAGRFLEFQPLALSCLSEGCCCSAPLEVTLRVPVLEDTAAEDVTELVDSWSAENLANPAESNSVCIKTRAVSKFVEGNTCTPRVSAFATVAEEATQTVCYCSPPAANFAPPMMHTHHHAPPSTAYGGYGYGGYSYGSGASTMPPSGSYSSSAPADSPSSTTPTATCYCTQVPVTTASVPVTPADVPVTAPISSMPPPAGTYDPCMRKVVVSGPGYGYGLYGSYGGYGYQGDSQEIWVNDCAPPAVAATYPAFAPPPLMAMYPPMAPTVTAQGTPVVVPTPEPTPSLDSPTATNSFAPPTGTYSFAPPTGYYGYGGYGYGAGYGTPAPIMASASVKAAALSVGTCYCRFDAAASAFELSAPNCKSALYAKCASGSMLACSTLDSYFGANDIASKQAITEFLFEDCPPEAPCACQGLSFIGSETATEKAGCCANLRVACQPLFGGVACSEVETFCSDNLASPILAKFVQHKLHEATCDAKQVEVVQQMEQAAVQPGGLSSAQVAGIVVGVVAGVAVLAGVAFSVLKAAKASAGAAAAPLLAAPTSAPTSGPQLLGISS